jgi:hypothetical protein
MATINHKTYNEATETFKDFSVYDGKETLIFKVDGSEGNVGIGTSSPTDTIGYGRALDIQSSTGAVVYLRDSNAPTTQYGFLAFDGTDNGLKLQNANSSGFLRFDTNATEKMRITAAGNVGIGTTSPATKLDVAFPSDGTAGAVFGYTGGTNNPRIFFNVNESTSKGQIIMSGSSGALDLGIGAGGTEIITLKGTGNVGIGTSTANTLLSIDGAADNGLSIQGIGTTSTRAFFGLDTSGDGYMSLTNGGTFATNVQLTSDLGVNNYILGNVGIGTSSPDTKLQVAGTGATGLSIRSNTSGDAFMRYYLDGVVASDAYVDRSTGNLNIRSNQDNAAIAFSTSAALIERMRITSAGNVGIGRTPYEASGFRSLDIDGSNGSLFLLRTSGTTNLSIGTSSGNPTIKAEAGKSLSFYTDATQVANITPNGITFGADTAAANALDDYEEGTWTGTLRGSVSDPSTAVTATGRYTKIGRKVTVEIQMDGKDTTGASGNLKITGMPFASSIEAQGSTFFDLTGTLGAGNTGAVCFASPFSTDLVFYGYGSAVSWAPVTHNAGTARSLRATLTYFV